MGRDDIKGRFWNVIVILEAIQQTQTFNGRNINRFILDGIFSGRLFKLWGKRLFQDLVFKKFSVNDYR